MHQSQAVQTPALRVIGNIVTGDDHQTQTVIDFHVLPRLKQMLDSPNLKKALKKEVCWTISNITAGTPNQIEAVIQADIFDSLIYHLTYSDFDVKKEAAWAIANATSSGTPEQIQHMCQKGCIKPLCDLLEVNDARIVAVALEGIENILEKGDLYNSNENPYANYIEDIEAVPKIEHLQLHANQSIADKALSIIKKFFSSGSGDDTDEESDEDLSFSGNSDQSSSFSFGVSNNAPFSFS